MTPEQFMIYLEEIFTNRPLVRFPTEKELEESNCRAERIEAFRDRLTKVEIDTKAEIDKIERTEDKVYRKLSRHFNKSNGSIHYYFKDLRESRSFDEIHQLAQIKSDAQKKLREAEIEYRLIRDKFHPKLITPDQEIVITCAELDFYFRERLGEIFFDEVTKFYRDVIDRLYPLAEQIMEQEFTKIREEISSILKRNPGLNETSSCDPHLFYKDQIWKDTIQGLDLVTGHGHGKLTDLNDNRLSKLNEKHQYLLDEKEKIGGRRGKLVKKYLYSEFVNELRNSGWLKVRDRFIELCSSVLGNHVTLSKINDNDHINKRYLYVLYRDKTVYNSNTRSQYPVYRLK